MSLVPIDPKNEGSVITLLEVAASWLSEAVHRGEAGEVAAVKAQIATAAEATKQLGLSKEIQLDAQEMVRRAEYALGKAIRRGQAEGTIATQGRRHDLLATSEKLPHAVDIDRSIYQNGSQIMTMVDGVEPETFDAAVTEAKSEGNLSRANVVRKVKKEDGPTTRDQRADLIRDLADKGYSSRQMPNKVGVSEETCREIARAYGISIPADKQLNRGRRIDWTDAVAQTVVALENSVEFIENQVDLSEVDLSEADEWVSSLTKSIRALNRFVKQIKEQTHV